MSVGSAAQGSVTMAVDLGLAYGGLAERVGVRGVKVVLAPLLVAGGAVLVAFGVTIP